MSAINHNIVQNGLVLNLDASNPKSYIGSGIIWKDLSGNKNNCTLLNGVVFSGNTMFFDGINDYIKPLFDPIFTNKITIIAWVKLDSSNISGPFIAAVIVDKESSYRLIFNNGGFQTMIATPAFGWYAGNNPALSCIANITLWNQIALTYDGSIQKLYLNGVFKQSSVLTGNILNVSTVSFMGLSVSNVASGKGNLSTLLMYNRGISESEIQQNYNATKSKFGL